MRRAQELHAPNCDARHVFIRSLGVNLFSTMLFPALLRMLFRLNAFITLLLTLVSFEIAFGKSGGTEKRLPEMNHRGRNNERKWHTALSTLTLIANLTIYAS